MAIIEAKNIYHEFIMGHVKVPVLHDINFQIDRGEFVSLCGTSGSGKSTLLNLIAGLMKPTKGDILIEGECITKMNENQLCYFRQKHIGFIFQSYNLMSYLTAQENVELPLIFLGMGKKEREEKAEHTLHLVGLSDRRSHRPTELSGGQQQRVSIARALAADPGVVLADEPTGNLDSKIGREIIDLLRVVNEQQKTTFLIVTHDTGLAGECDRTLFMKDGRIVKEGD